MKGEERRTYVLRLMKEAGMPMTGTALADDTGVSRQVIVQDIALLKAKNEPIVATPQGYLYLGQNTPRQQRRVIACKHTPEQTELELNTLVDHGVNIIDVIVEHPFYGEIQGALRIQTREDVGTFIRKWRSSQASLLSTLTDGVHLHTIESDERRKLDRACSALADLGILFEQNDEPF